MPEKIYMNIGENPIGFDAAADHYTMNKQLLSLIESTNIGLWERSIDTNDAWWSPKFCDLLGYQYGELEPNYNYLINKIVHPNDAEMAYTAFQDHLHNRMPYKAEFRMMTKAKGYRWFESWGKAWLDDTGKPMRMLGAIIDVDIRKRFELESKRSEFLLRETNKIAHVGGWELDVASQELTWSKEVYEIHEIDTNQTPDCADAIAYYEPDYRNQIAEAVKNAIEHCMPYDMELQLRTAKDNVIWVRTKGLLIMDDYGKCITLRGIFQNINDRKLKELHLLATLNLLNDQNKRLHNFAHIVSHNLRSHTGNLEFMVNLLDENITIDDQREIVGNIRSVSKSLSTTIEHLSEIVKIQTEINNDRKELKFAEIFESVTAAVETNIAETGAIIETDFSMCPTINYVPAYLESILLNLLTNSLKYKHPDRKPHIMCKTFLENSHTFLTFSDNGLGIDMVKFGDKIFGMYKTFHKNANAKGIGLFITRNQIESLGGNISVESTVNIGTTFTIKLL